jgi:hypothetical protein
MDLILDVTLIVVVIGVTAICGATAAFYMAPKSRWLTRLVLSFVLGFAFIELVGILSGFLGVNSIIPQVCTVLVCAGLFLFNWKKIASYRDRHLDREDKMALAFTSLYLFICLFFFDRIIIWMGGDSLAHGEIIRMLLDGRQVPISIPLIGSYWEYYPKGFHLFCYPWAKIFPLLNVLRTIPILITAMTMLLFYSIIRELDRKDESIYALILAGFVFSAQYSNIIWAGYPTITSEMFLVASLLSMIVNKKLLPIFLLGVLFSHGRMMFVAGSVLLSWMAVTYFGRYRHIIWHNFVAKLIIAVAAVGMAAGIAISSHSPQFLVSVMSDQSLASTYAARWYPAFLSILGAVMAFSRRSRMDQLALSWAGAVGLIVLLADAGPLEFVGSADRLLLDLYLPLSILASGALAKMQEAGPRVRTGFILVLVLCGSLGMVAVFSSYQSSWAIPEEDYKAIMWLGEQNYSDALCINLDETGAWIYPLTGMPVARNRFLVGPVPLKLNMIGKISATPGSYEVLNALKSIKSSGFNRCLIFVSNVSLSRPGYVPPFAESSGKFPVVSMKFPTNTYDIIYSHGAYIIGFPKGAFSKKH